MPVFDRVHDIAACLGLDEATLRRLQARGYLRTFDLSEAEIRERLYRAHRRHLLARSQHSGLGGPYGVDGRLRLGDELPPNARCP